MPEIPSFNLNVRLPSSQGARITGGSGIGEGLINVGKALSALGDLEKKKQDIADLNEATRLVNESSLGLENGLDLLRRQGLPAMEYGRRAAEFTDEYLKNAGSASKKLRTPEAQAFLTRKLDEFRLTTLVKVSDESDQRFRDETRAFIVNEMPKFRERAARAESDVELASVVGDMRTFLGSHAGLALKVEESQKMFLDQLDNIREDRYRGVIRANPELGLSLLSQQDAGGLRPESVERLSRFAEARVRVMAADEARRARAQDRLASKRAGEIQGNLERDILAGKNVLDRLQGDEGIALGDKVSDVANFQRTWIEGAAKAQDIPSNPRILARYEYAAVSGFDPENGSSMGPQEFLSLAGAGGLSFKDAARLAGVRFEKAESARGKAETIRDKKITKGERMIKQLIGMKDGAMTLLMPGASGDPDAVIIEYETMREFRARIENEPNADPIELADILAKRAARGLIEKYTFDAHKLFTSLGVRTFEDFKKRARAGQIPKRQAEGVLRMIEFLEFREQATKIPAAGGQAPREQPKPVAPERDRLAVFFEFMKSLFTEGSGGVASPKQRAR